MERLRASCLKLSQNSLLQSWSQGTTERQAMKTSAMMIDREAGISPDFHLGGVGGEVVGVAGDMVTTIDMLQSPDLGDRNNA